MQKKKSALNVMNFLNEISGQFPDAISFASGRPNEALFNYEEWVKSLPSFVANYSSKRGITTHEGMQILAQYGKTNGIINEHIKKQIKQDEKITCEIDEIIVTSGCQEAMSLVVNQICSKSSDVILAASPCYVGITGVAEVSDKNIAYFDSSDETSYIFNISKRISELRASGMCPRILYLVPDFDNPTAAVLSQKTRLEVIDICHINNILILEDNPYSVFRYSGRGIPNMYSLDKHNIVVYLGTYSKILCPTLRLGFAIINAKLSLRFERNGIGLMSRISQAKSFATLNTSQLSQAILGGVLEDRRFTLRREIDLAIELYRSNLQEMVNSLKHVFKDTPLVSWNIPEGGFFLVLTLPFEFDEREVTECARDYGVIVMPISFFSSDDKNSHQIRLAFSNVDLKKITVGVEMLSLYIRNKIKTL